MSALNNKLEKTTELVKAIIDECPDSKNNYNELVLRTWRACGAKFPDSLINFVRWHCPSPETISRAHRRIKHDSKLVKYPDGSMKVEFPYRPDPKVLADRKAKQISMTNLFKEESPGEPTG